MAALTDSQGMAWSSLHFVGEEVWSTTNRVVDLAF